jgi:hypothetical protein
MKVTRLSGELKASLPSDSALPLCYNPPRHGKRLLRNREYLSRRDQRGEHRANTARTKTGRLHQCPAGGKVFLHLERYV